MQPTVLRGHRYTFLGTRGGLPVLQAPETDSMLRDRQHLTAPAILTVRQVRAPTTSEGRWPGPPGNLYVSLPHALSAAGAQQWLSAGVNGWLSTHARGVVLVERWDDGFGAHRVGGRFVTGMVVAPQAVGVDIHLAGEYPQGSEHVALSAICQSAVGVEQALWGLLERLV